MVVWYSYGDVDSHARAEWCPSVVSTSASPTYPSWSPFVSGYPCPSVVVVMYPPAIMERCPAPAVVGYPGIAVVGHGPIAIAHVGLETRTHIGNPDISMFIIVDPVAIGSQFVIE